LCRLLYVNSKEEFSIAEYLKKFAGVAKQSREYQGHGWGFAFSQYDKWNYYKNIKPIWEDDLTQFGKSKRIIAHARSAFKDEGIVVENKIKEEGRIGAEKIFNYIQRFDKGNIKAALQKGTGIISTKSAYVKAMNILLTDKSAAYVYSQFNEDEDYFTIHRKIKNETIIVCSDPFAGEIDWEPVQNNSLTEYKCL